MNTTGSEQCSSSSLGPGIYLLPTTVVVPIRQAFPFTFYIILDWSGNIPACKTPAMY